MNLRPSPYIALFAGTTSVRTPPRILIVDDNPTNVKVLQTRLVAEGYEVVTAGDGEEGLATARQQIPDLILLDVMMPKLDGFEVCRRLRADSEFPFTPIIMVTAMADSKDVIAGLEAGGDEYLTKPVDHAALAARVRSMLRIKRLHCLRLLLEGCCTHGQEIDDLTRNLSAIE